jgi:phosphatidylglycerophosphate synthase
VRTVQTGPAIGLIGQLALLCALAGTVGLSSAAWVLGIVCGAFTYAALTRGLALAGMDAMGPADRITLARVTLVGGVAALIADSFERPAHVGVLAVITTVALMLDAVDGYVARRTGTVSTLGARFDMEADAFLIFILSVYVARSAGAWVLGIGLARYAYVVAGWMLPWLRGSVPPRYWRKVVAAIQGIMLAAAMAAILPYALTIAALAGAAALLAESFGRDVWWLWRRSAAGVRINVRELS